MKFTILDEERATEVDATTAGGRILVDAGDFEHATGWALRPEGLCREAVCMPVPPGSTVVRDGRIDVAAFADLAGRPLAAEVEAGAACLGDSARERSDRMRGGVAPDFTLPDLDGRRHSLGDYRGRKALLLAWASW